MAETHIMWHRRDLRIHDNRALFECLKDSNKKIIPVFIIDPFFFKENKLDSDDRILFMFECIEDLIKSYRKIGLDMHLYFGNSVDIILKLQKKYSAKIFYNYDSSMIFGFQRDQKIKHNPFFLGFNNDAITREENSRKNWAEKAQKYFDSDLYNIDLNKKYLGVMQDKKIKLDKVAQKYNLKKSQKYILKGGEEVALKQLDTFLRKHLNLYSKSISKPEISKLNCSRLSAHLSLGAISSKFIYNEVMKTNYSKAIKDFFITRLFWREHFTQKLEDYPFAQEKPINQICIIEKNRDEFLINSFFNAKTGFPIIDAAIISLKQTGWINFRSRAMLASFFSLILKQNWKIGADFMHRYLVDADIAINYEQWQMQSGLVGVHPLRIYNPEKMIKNHDQLGIFIKKNLKLFKDVKEIDYLCNPLKFAYQLKIQYGIEIGVDYPKPIVNFELEAKETRLIFKNRLVQIRKSMNNPNFFKKASLSNSRKKNNNKKNQSEEKNKIRSKEKNLGDFI